MNRKQRKLFYRIIAAAVLLAAAWLAPVEGVWKLLCCLVPYFIAGYDVLWAAVRNIARGNAFDEKFLMALATVGALCIGEYPEAVFVMVFFQIGELFESIAVGKSRSSISALMDIRPDSANLERDGETVEVSPEEVAVGDVIVVKPGERIPLDGEIIEGASSLNTTALTGESVPRDVEPGDAVISGCINLSGLMRIRVTKSFGESTVSRILELVEDSASHKSRSENFITRFAAWYTPVVVIAALLLAVLPPLFVGGWADWIHRALVFLVISCPCALVISVPLSFFGGIGGAGKHGILIKGSNYMDALTSAEIVVFDKTGTLTRGSFSVTGVYPENCAESELVELAALAESYSDHPISRSLRDYCGKALDTGLIGGEEELAGRGVRALISDREVLVGNEKLMAEHGIAFAPRGEAGTLVYVARDKEYMGCILISDTVKPDAAEAIKRLKEQGIKKTVMLTGDREETAKAVASGLGIDEYHAGLLPTDKVELVERLLAEKSPKGKLAFVGDGINDAPVLSRADIGIAMGALGSDSAIEAADVVLMDDKPSKIALALDIARYTKRIVTENIAFALAVKAAVLVLGAIGRSPMWLAVFADVGVCVIAVLNAMRTLK